MSPFNAYERFSDLFTNTVIKDELDPLLKKVAISVPDMRVLRNIVNEFYFYRKVLRNDSVGEQRLLAFIVYKNIYSDDFAKLYTSELSAIDLVVVEKERIRTEYEHKLQEAYDDLMTEERAANEELLGDENEYFWVLYGAIVKN